MPPADALCAPAAGLHARWIHSHTPAPPAPPCPARAAPPAPRRVSAAPATAVAPVPFAPATGRSYLTTQDLDLVRNSLATRMAIEAPVQTSKQRQQQQQQQPTPAAPAAAPAKREYNPSQGWQAQPHHLSKAQLWERVREESKRDADAEPTLASFLYSSVLAHRSLEQALAFVLANKLASPTLYSTQLKQIAEDVYREDPAVFEAALADLQAVLDRDPACDKYTTALLHFKGYQAVQAHRVAHHLWARGRRALALMLQSRISEAFHVDVHPAASLGRGILLDHATGVVIGETAVIGDNVSMLHHVTLGGSGIGGGARHPVIGHGVLLGAGVTVLGPVTLGAGAKVGAGSVVVTDLEPHSVAVGVPARVIKRAESEPCDDMDQIGFLLDYVI
ncbi:MAG: trimeric LpxA-like protein [Monoraphidium minutum]|nr:MAG: trimeric LpxA-like protein [Monoraphidium minutum]